MDERQKKAFDFVSDYTKQLITLATGIITFMVTFLQEELKASSIYSKWLLVISWALFILSICFGIIRLMALTGNLDPVGAEVKPQLTITTPNVRNPGKIQILSFLTALVLSVIFGGIKLFDSKPKDSKDKTILILQQHVIDTTKSSRIDTIYPIPISRSLSVSNAQPMFKKKAN